MPTSTSSTPYRSERQCLVPAHDIASAGGKQQRVCTPASAGTFSMQNAHVSLRPFTVVSRTRNYSGVQSNGSEKVYVRNCHEDGREREDLLNLYTIILFLHVSGAIGYFVGIGTWLFILVGLRRAQRVEQVRAFVNLIGLSGPFSGI